MILQQLKYEIQLYFKGTAFVMPSIAIIVFLYVLYSVKPLDIMSGYLITCIFVFLVMVWIGISEIQRELPVMEQILYLKIGNAGKYYFGKVAFLIFLSLMISLVCTVFPFIQNQFNEGNMFMRQFVFSDLVNAFMLQAGCGICGVSLGNLLHERFFSNRKLAITLTVLLVVLSFSRYGITQEIPFLKIIMWILPPIMLPQQIFDNEIYFNISKSSMIFGILFFYAIAYFCVKSVLCQKKKF